MENPWRPDDKQADWARKIIALLSGGISIATGSSVTVDNTPLNPVPVQQGDLNADVDEVTAYGGNLETLIDSASATVTYICEAVPKSPLSSPVWRVSKIDTSSNPKTVKFAGTGIFDQIADNRASLTY